MSDPFTPIEAKMRAAALPDALISVFRRHYEAYRAGESGRIPWGELDPPEAADIIDAGETERFREAGTKLLDKLVVIKLNGGLGTTMKLDGPKSLIPVREGRCFLELVAEQIRRLRERHGARTPLNAQFLPIVTEATERIDVKPLPQPERSDVAA